MDNRINIKMVNEDKIYSWSYGEVKNAATISYRTLLPIKGGLFCLDIFGSNSKCIHLNNKEILKKLCRKCNSFNKIKSFSKERMGHIKLACTITNEIIFNLHLYKISKIILISVEDIKDICEYRKFVVIKEDKKGIKIGTIIKKEEIKNLLCLFKCCEIKTGINAIIKLVLINKNDKEGKNIINDLIIKVIPVIPIGIRPLIRIKDKRFISSDINELYRKILISNNRIKFMNKNCVDKNIIFKERKRLQILVNNLFYRGEKGSNKKYKSISNLIEGKYGRIRYNLLGKRVNFSGRSVISVDSLIKVNECKLPLKIGIKLFYPLLIKAFRLKRIDYWNNKLIEKVLRKISKNYPIMLNRAPSLHRKSIQAFYPLITNEEVIRIHPLTCKAFNADFDGDQMAIYLPLTRKGIKEVNKLMIVGINNYSDINGNIEFSINHEAIIGLFNLINNRKENDKNNKILDVRKVINGIWNRIKDKNKRLRKIERLCRIGFNYVTKIGFTIGFSEINPYWIINNKRIGIGFKKLNKLRGRNDRIGEIGNDYLIERINREILRNKNKKGLLEIITSKAKNVIEQIKQILGVKGRVFRDNKSIFNLPIIKNLGMGLNEIEYFITIYGSRKGLIDTAIKTAISGYLTRRLIGVMEDCVILRRNCGINKGRIYRIDSYEKRVNKDYLFGKELKENIFDINGKMLLEKGKIIGDEEINKMERSYIRYVSIGNPMLCVMNKGICQSCYGSNLSTLKKGSIGLGVGIRAVYSICEPSTQLTMRTFHTGGIISKEEINGINLDKKGFIEIGSAEIYKTNNCFLLGMNGEVLKKYCIDIGNDIKKRFIKENKYVLIERNQLLFKKIVFNKVKEIRIKRGKWNKEKKIEEGILIDKDKDEGIVLKIISINKIRRIRIDMGILLRIVKKKGSKLVIINLLKDRIIKEETIDSINKVIGLIEGKNFINEEYFEMNGCIGRFNKKYRIINNIFNSKNKTFVIENNKKIGYINGKIVLKGNDIYETEGINKLIKVIGLEGFGIKFVKKVKEIYGKHLIDIKDIHIELIVKNLILRDIDKDKIIGLNKIGLKKEGFLSKSAGNKTIKTLINAALNKEKDFLLETKGNVIIGRLVPIGIGLIKRIIGNGNIKSSIKG